jgi:hypothetical protein
MKKRFSVILYESALMANEIKDYLKFKEVGIILIVNTECTPENIRKEQEQYYEFLHSGTISHIKRMPTMAGIYTICILPIEEYDMALKLQRHCENIYLVGTQLESPVTETDRIKYRSWMYINNKLQEITGESKKSKKKDYNSSNRRSKE